MVLPIVTYGDQALRCKAVEVEDITPQILDLARDMLDTMYASRGLGLAAEQVGRTEKICVIDVPLELEKEMCREFNAAIKMPLILINPEIVAHQGEQRDDEGCLSFPEIGAKITRANQVTVKYLDLGGGACEVVACGLLARAIQHETDHLNGVLLVDRMSAAQKMSAAGKLKRLQRRNAGTTK